MLSLGLLAMSPAAAQQRLISANGQLVQVDVPIDDLARIQVEGANIRTYVANEGELMVQSDDQLGQIYVRVLKFQGKPVSLFISDDHGRTHALSLRPLNIAAQSILIKSTSDAVTANDSVSKRVRKNGPSSTIEADMVYLMRVMVTHENNAQVSRQAQGIPHPTLESALIVSSSKYKGLIGEEIRLYNHTESTLLVEEGHLQVSPQYLAIAVPVRKVAPKSSTLAYIIRLEP